MDGAPKPNAASRSLVSVTGGGIEVPTVLVDGRHLLVRLFNGEGDASERTVSLYARPVRVDLVELNGGVSRPLTVQRAGNGRYEVKVAMPRFGIRTLRCEMNAAQG
jgi:alpha-mannosidase